MAGPQFVLTSHPSCTAKLNKKIQWNEKSFKKAKGNLSETDDAAELYNLFGI